MDFSFLLKTIGLSVATFAISLWFFAGGPLPFPMLVKKPLERSAELPTFQDVRDGATKNKKKSR